MRSQEAVSGDQTGALQTSLRQDKAIERIASPTLLERLAGDVGEWRDGNLRLIDRARDFLVTSGGKTISPSFIENILRASPYIAEAIVLGHGRKYLTALIEIDFDTAAEWARSNDVAYTGFTSLAQSARVTALIRGEVDKANGQLARVEQIKAFRVLPKVLDPEEEGEPVTPTRKVKRGQMYERFKALVDEMYDDEDAVRRADKAVKKKPEKIKIESGAWLDEQTDAQEDLENALAASCTFETRSLDWGAINAKLEQSFKAGAWANGEAKARMTKAGFSAEAQAAIAIGAQFSLEGELKWFHGIPFRIRHQEYLESRKFRLK
jgi:hypothetical protein